MILMWYLIDEHTEDTLRKISLEMTRFKRTTIGIILPTEIYSFRFLSFYLL